MYKNLNYEFELTDMMLFIMNPFTVSKTLFLKPIIFQFVITNSINKVA